MKRGRCWLGVDFGTKRIGLALSDSNHRVAVPLATYERGAPARDADYFRAVVARQNIGGLVIGLPLHLSGDAMRITTKARQFGDWLGRVTGLPSHFWDERLTSSAAETYLREAGLVASKRRNKLDMVAAQIMLQSFLDAGCPPSPPHDPVHEPNDLGSPIE